MRKTAARRGRRFGEGGLRSIALLAAVGLVAGCAEEPERPAPRSEGPVRLWTPDGLLWRFPADEGTILENGLSLRVGPDAVFVLDRMAGRVLRLSPDGAFRNAVGRPGEGPGELEGPVALQIGADGDVWVSAPGPNRLTRFAPGGAIVTEYRTPYPVANFVVAGDRPLVPSLRLDRLLDALDVAGDTTALAPEEGAVPARLREDVVDRVQFQGLPMASPAPGTVYLLQNGHGTDFSLWRVEVDPAGRRLGSIEGVPLPGWLYGLMAADLEELRRELSEEFAQGDFTIPFKNLHAEPDGRLTLVPGPSHRLLALSLSAGGDTADVVVPSDGGEHRELMDAVVSGGRLLALYPTEVRAYALRRRWEPAGAPIPDPSPEDRR